ncbi:SxtJ family membrane protein [Candidatus Nitronereus thalassa]|uniref:SxtJ family membrane protein n=1 Tax=Candidatus Nitronereus thalassa TaxID=3020898 RepID=A0ABU3K3I1_9BACT|nr:SxtJ family membrane protein [Candidatus Nitronereus thalassa]MDT7040949.1 SxtJ family membrane protein [Candidatus Nitronereus thalassa]
MATQTLSHDPPEVQPKQLRSFGFLVGGIFTLIALWPLIIRQEPIRMWAIALGCLLILAGGIVPIVLRPLFVGWMKVGHALGFINTRIILSIGYFLVFTPIGLFRRMMGKDSLQRKLKPDQTTYRSPRQTRQGEHMKKQY